MGQDYSYTQPSSSAESLDMTSLLEAECELYKDEDDSRILHQVLKVAYLRLCVAIRVTQNILKTMDPKTSYTNLLFSQSQTTVDLDSPEPFWLGSQGPNEPVVESGGDPKERRKWSPKEDKILIGAWLNTSKDAVVSNDQRAGAFWKRIVEYYNASPQLAGTTPREVCSCKKRWGRINADVSKFAGCYDAALREQRSGQNDDDVMKAAIDIFLKTNDYKFSMDHCWRELRHDQKWCSTYGPKECGKEKRKGDVEADGGDEAEGRPIGVKAAKAASKKKKSGKEESLAKIHAIMEIKEKLSKQKVLERLLGKKEPLTEMETSLQLKLMAEMFSSSQICRHLHLMKWRKDWKKFWRNTQKIYLTRLWRIKPSRKGDVLIENDTVKEDTRAYGMTTSAKLRHSRLINLDAVSA
uniref:Myb-like domain-containing protein n=1 Tax=Brassica oleracea var. oleracea TaxID=109376 RepID=A0A0D3DD53_BRAOL